MSAPLHASLTPDQRQELRPRARLRVECLLLSAGGLKVPQLAAHLDCCEATVRTLLHRFAEEGLEAVHPQPPGFPSDLVHRQRIEEALDRLLQRPRTWTVTTLSAALAAEEDIHLKPRTVRFYLKRMGAQWRRTHANVHHKQDPDLAAAAVTTLAGLKKSPKTRSWTSSSSTKPASAPPCPPTYTWAPAGVRPVVPYENPEGRRVNVLAALAAPGTHRHAPLTWWTASHPGRGNTSSTSCATPCPGAQASRASWSSTTPPATAPGRCARPRRTFTATKTLTAAVETAFGQVNAQLLPEE